MRAAAGISVALLACGAAGCSYADDVDRGPTAAAGPRPARTAAAKDPEVLAVETRNYAAVEQRLANLPGQVVLADSGPADGPGVGFRKAATVRTAGPHAVTVACVGLPALQVSLSQEIPGGTRHTVLDVDCSKTQTQEVELQEGYVSAQLVAHRDPAGAWTGAVAGIRITVR